MDTGAFREDLFYRLSVLRLDLPPLRQRGEDAELLAGYFLAQIERETDNGALAFAPDALAALSAYSWPGNVRELKNAIERAVVMSGSDVIRSEHLLFQRRRDAAPVGVEESCALIRIPANGKTLNEIESEAIRATLALVSGNLSAAARLLGISRPTLARKLRQAGLTRRSVLVAE